jgi:release factor glutamine methyltransferase
LSTDPRTVASLLALARSLGLTRLDAQLLVAHMVERDRAWVIAHPEADVGNSEPVAIAMRRRAAGEPLAYLVGRKAFHGLELAVDQRVLIPRPETEILVEWALELLDGPLAGLPQARVLDLGTGSGAIALALKAARPRIDVTAIDVSEAALEVARSNAARLGLAVTFTAGDWWHALDGTNRRPHFELIVANPPYVREGDPHLASLSSEPTAALVSGRDGLDAMRTIIAGAGQYLSGRGWLLVEHGHDQADPVAGLMAAHGLRDIDRRVDLNGVVRCCGGRSPSSVDRL